MEQSISGYQLVLLVPESLSYVNEFTSRLNSAIAHALSHLGLDRKFLRIISREDGASGINGRLPSVAVFIGLQASPLLAQSDMERLRFLLNAGSLIIPVVADISRFIMFVPPEIAHLNGIGLSDCGTDFERLASRILEGFGLLREKRRLFISYRRIETSAVASQLYEALDAAGFDVFLDTHGILRPGEPFQDVLWHRLADTDVALLLDSPDFLQSRWGEEELARANASNIQILQILWPGQVEVAAAAFSTFHQLSNTDFVGPETLGSVARLLDECIGVIVDAIESLRARAVGARQAFLVREFVMEARRAGFSVHTTLERTLVLGAPSGDKLLVLPAIGVPDAERLEGVHQLHQREMNLGRAYTQPPVLLYDRTGIRTRWLDHLNWLNSNLACARSISLADAKKWLSDLGAQLA